MDPTTVGIVVAFFASGPAAPIGRASEREVRADQPLRQAITVHDPTGCIESADLAEDIAAWLGRSTVAACETIVVHHDRAPTDVARFEVTYCDGEVVRRAFDPAPSDCAGLTAIVALAISLSLDENALVEIVGSAPPTASPPDVAAIDGKAATTVDDPSPRREPGQPTASAPGPTTRGSAAPELRLYALAQASSGAVPGWSFGGGIGVGIAWRPWLVTRFTLAALHRPDVEVGSVSVRATLVPIGLDQCVAATVRRFSFGPCAGVAAGPFVADGGGRERGQRDVVAWAAVTFAFPTEIALGHHLGLGADLGVVVPFVRPRIRAREPGPVAFRDVAPIGATFAVFVVGRIPPRNR